MQSRWARFTFVSVAVAVGAGFPAVGTASAPVPATDGVRAVPVCGPPAPGHRACLSLALPLAARGAAERQAMAANAAPAGYGPADIEKAYGVAAAAAADGGAMTVAVVDAYHDPNLASDLATYRSQYGLPACGSGCLSVQSYTTHTDPSASSGGGGWELEESLDVDAVSAACPLCHLLVVEAADASDPSLISATTYALQHASVVSLSFGGCESPSTTGPDFDAALRTADKPVTVSSGDDGYYYTASQGTRDNPSSCNTGTPDYPASSQYVTAVGGTTLTKAGNARGFTETAWSYSGLGNGAAGSGCSTIEPKPTWQKDTGCSMRTVADTSADADPNTGLAVYDSFTGGGGWVQVGGTSLSAPLIAGMYGLAGAPAADIDGHIWYEDQRVNDVTSGSNAPPAIGCLPNTYICTAQAGYDGPTGMGTPGGVPSLVATVTPLPATETTTAVPISWSPPAGTAVSSYTLWEDDTTTGVNGANTWRSVLNTSGTSATFYGFTNHTYGFAVQWTGSNGATDGPPTTAQTSTSLSGATPANPYTGMYAVDGTGALHPASSPPLPTSGTWPGWNIVRGLVPSATGEGGVVLDGFGGLHPFGDSASATGSAYWNGWDITRGITTLPGGVTGYVLDGLGGLHPFAVGSAALPAGPSITGYWPSRDIARAVASFSDGSGGLVLDGLGGLHPFGVTGVPIGAPRISAYWPNWDIARALVLLPGSTASSYQGYVLDGLGGLWPFSGGSAAMPAHAASQAYWPNWDIARAVVLEPASSTAGWILDGFGGFNPFGGAPSVQMNNYAADAPYVRGAGVA